ncbi:hypothetical protein HNV12_02620 [Methanococcoides sp. SA1]|nr:hypothetical protein [Methanococcoides sp. SA1]
MSIVNVIEKHRPPFYLMDVSRGVVFENTIDKGLMIEGYVQDWLSQIDEINVMPSCPDQKWIYILDRTEFGQFCGTNFFTGDRAFEFDGLVEWGGKVYPYEVKSNQLKGYTNKIEKNIDIMKTIFPTSKIGELLVFYRMGSSDARKYADKISSEHNGEVRFVNLGYTQRDLKGFLRRKKKMLERA